MNPPAPSHRDIDPLALARMLDTGEALLVDVREPDEFAAGHIAGAINMPLSRFDPASLPERAGRKLILNCAAGGRSGKALAACDAARAAVDGHLAGGIGAWRAAGLPLVAGA
ncbi:rhodanese-like domain-containing protein [Thermaurantiacus sp.]